MSSGRFFFLFTSWCNACFQLFSRETGSFIPFLPLRVDSLFTPIHFSLLIPDTIISLGRSESDLHFEQRLRKDCWESAKVPFCEASDYSTGPRENSSFSFILNDFVPNPPVEASLYSTILELTMIDVVVHHVVGDYCRKSKQLTRDRGGTRKLGEGM